MNTFWDFLVKNFLSPITLWNDGNDLGDPGQYFLAIVAAIFMWVIPLIIIWLIVHFIIKGVLYLIRREHCQHCNAWTIGPAGKAFADCEADKPCCADCYMEHEAAAEPRYECPVDGSQMEKHINSVGCIIDVCPGCGAVLVSGAELQVMLDDAEDDGKTSGMLTGIAVGIAVN